MQTAEPIVSLTPNSRVKIEILFNKNKLLEANTLYGGKMTVSPFSLLLTLVGGLILAALTGWIRKSRLILFVPRLFSYSALVQKNGQLAEVSVFNRGFKTEEQIEVSMAPTLKYEIVGATNSDITIVSNKLLIPRIGSGDDVTVLLLVEGGVFSLSEISNCLSKESKGVLVSKQEEIPMTGPQRITMVAVFFVLPAILLLGYFGIDSYFQQKIAVVGKEVTQKATEQAAATVIAATSDTKVIQGWTVPALYTKANGTLFQLFSAGKIKIFVGEISRKRDLTTIPVTVTNETGLVIRAMLTMNSQYSEEKIPSFDRRVEIPAYPGTTVTKSLTIVIPQKSATLEDQKAYIELFVREAEGDTLKIAQVLNISEKK